MLVKKKRIPIFQMLTFGVLPSFLKVHYYRLKGATIGKNVKINFGSVIISPKITIGDNSKIGFFSVIQSKNIEIGNNTTIGMMNYFNVDKINISDDVTIRENNLFGGLDIGRSELVIGYLSHIHQKCFINTTLPVNIGSNTAIGGGSYIFTHSSWQSVLDGYPCTYKPVTIGSNVWISWDCFILPGVEIGDNSLIGAKSYVTKSIPVNSLATGNPAKVIIPSGLYPRSLADEERTQLIEEILKDFHKYLESNDIIAKHLILNGNFVLQIFKDECLKHQYYFIPELKKINNEIESSVTFLSLNLNNKIKQDLNLSKISWIDLELMERSGTDIYTEEIISFLKHYGLRFQKVDV